MLAEPRHRLKWSEDPQNTQWSQDTSKFGYQMLEKMGWSEGKGLGPGEDGVVEHVKVVKRRVNLGLGSKTDHSENWLANQDDFNDLLMKLNQKKSGDATVSKEEKESSSLKNSVKQSKKKIFYSKFIHSKDLSLKSASDLACIMGKRSKSTPSTPQALSEDEGGKSDASVASCPAETAEKETSIVTTNSAMNLQEYFAIRMAALKQRSQGYSAERKNTNKKPAQESAADDYSDVKKKSKKGKKIKKEKLENQDEDCLEIKMSNEPELIPEIVEDVEAKSKKRKKSKKSRKTDKEDTSKLIDNDDSDSSSIKKGLESEEISVKSKKSKKKRKREEEEVEMKEEDSREDDCKTKKKKKKRSHKEDESSVTVDESSDLVTVKKKKIRKT